MLQRSMTNLSFYKPLNVLVWESLFNLAPDTLHQPQPALLQPQV